MTACLLPPSTTEHMAGWLWLSSPSLMAPHHWREDLRIMITSGGGTGLIPKHGHVVGSECYWYRLFGLWEPCHLSDFSWEVEASRWWGDEEDIIIQEEWAWSRAGHVNGRKGPPDGTWTLIPLSLQRTSHLACMPTIISKWSCSSLVKVSALHYSAWNQEGFGHCFSSCAAPNYPLLMSDIQVCAEVPRLTEVSGVVWEFRSQSGTEHSQRGWV